VTAADPPAYLAEFDQHTLARLLLARHRSGPDPAGPDAGIEAAVGLLDRLVEAAQAAGRGGGLVEARMVRALAHRAAGEDDAAFADLAAALTTGVAAGYTRLFLDEGPPMEELLRAATRSRAAAPWAEHAAALLRAAQRGPRSAAPVAPADDGLSDRELEVLRLLSTDLTGPEVARRLFVSVNTLRTHTKHIFTKLDVNTRRAAVRRAGELHLL
jgi:LuxR family maltose regulon positive regulatory protein